MASEIFGECALELRTQFSWQCNIGAVQLSLSVAGAKFDEVAFKLHIDFSWQVQYLVQFNIFVAGAKF